MILFVPLCFAASLAVALSIPRNNATFTTTGVDKRQGASDPASFTWVRRFAAVGDSYTAGIGSGEQLGGLFHNFNDWSCSRYDLAYPMIMRQYVGSSIENFQYPACTGDQTWQIFDQIQQLQGNLDLVTLTAGGNDLCLVDIIKDCIILAFYGEETCNAILSKAEENLQQIMRNNVKEILLALNSKMASEGIVVYNSYARFFNTDSNACLDQDWGLLPWVVYNWVGLRPDPLPLTTARRQRFNSLTSGLNDLIREVVQDVADEVNYKIGFSNWDLWPSEGVDGQMCSPSSSGAYPDRQQPDLQFFKPDTRKTFFRSPIGFKKRDLNAAQLQVENGTATTIISSPKDNPIPAQDPPLPPLTEADLDPALKTHLTALRNSLKTRDLDPSGVDRAVYRSSLWHSPNPRAAALHALNPRAPAVPGCPSEARGWLPGLGFFLPDLFGRIFHPNEHGHNAMASFAIAKTMDLRAEVLGVVPEVCAVTEEFRCWRGEGRRQYVTADRADANMKDFCASVEGPGSGYTNWRRTKVYHEGTPDEMEFILEAGDVDTVNREECLESFTRIVHGCDAGDGDNPMNWKFGGLWKKGEYSYDLSPRRNRNWPPLTAPTGLCIGHYKTLFSDFTMAGAGFSSWDWGQETVLPKSKGCLGLGVTKWHWEYFDEPDPNGMEWRVTFRTPVFVTNRCYKNNKVVQAVGGFTNGCGGDSWA